MKKEIAFIGLGKMGDGMVRKLRERDWNVRGLDKNTETVQKLAKIGRASCRERV